FDYDTSGTTNILQTAKSTSTVGDGDTLSLGGASSTDVNVVIGGVNGVNGLAIDDIDTGDSTDFILGDNGEMTWSDGLLVSIVSQNTAAGGTDDIDLGDGDKTVIAGMGSDFVDAADGLHRVIGDNGRLDYSAGVLDVMQSTAHGDGGNDAITLAGTNAVIGGFGTDTITTLGGDDIIIGDNGSIDYTASILIKSTDIDETTGAKDIIDAGAGFNVVLGGAGGDEIDSAGDDDIIIGDHGEVYFNDAGALKHVINTLPSIGGADIINAGAGDNIVFGGYADDQISVGMGNNIVIGDNGAWVCNPVDGSVQITSTDGGNDQGGNDIIEGGGGDDIFFGGIGDDVIDGKAGNDLIFGDQAVLTSRAGAANTNPRYRALQGGLLYDNQGEELVDMSQQFSGPSADIPTWSNWTITVGDGLDDLFGNDYLAGGADNDTIFGQRGNDTIQGDGSIASWLDETNSVSVGASRDANGLLQIQASFESSTDGDDYIEGGGENDVIFGNLGQDDIIGGNSELFGLTDASQRADGADLLFGGAGTATDRNHSGDASASGHARDADLIIGDNGNIFRIVGINGSANADQYLNFNYDNYNSDTGSLHKITVRAAQLLDYTPGGHDFDAVAAATDLGAADEVHGESGDDFIYGMVGNDLLFGDGQDDDIIGGQGHDWVSGGSGDDGVLGDDGRIYTSRNSSSYGESLNGIDPLLASDPNTRASNGNVLNELITTPGKVQSAVINVAGQLKKTVDLTPFSVGPNGDPLFDAAHADDIIYGGWGNDFLHGGSGDDAMSGAEALQSFYDNPGNLGDVLAYSATTGEFAAYDEYEPRTRIANFLLNFSAGEGTLVEGSIYSDGNDILFGDLGNDWLVGGTGNDNMYGGWGDDLLNADDDQGADGDLNDTPDTHASYEDRAFGGAGRDRLIGNTGGDRLIDWAGEFNSYIVPFAPFGNFTISRTLQPQLQEFLYALSAGDGADATRAADTGSDPDRNGEPEGELGLVRQQDFAWRDQTGAPDDPQPGNIPGGPRDVLRSANFNTGNMDSFAVDSGSWAVSGGALQVAAESLGADAAAVYHIEDAVPNYFEVQASVSVVKPTSGWKANSYIIFDYQAEEDFKFAGLNVSTNKLEVGHRDASGWHVDKQSSFQGGIKADRTYNLLLSVNGLNVTLLVDNKTTFSHTFTPRVIDGWSVGLNYGLVGMGSDNSRGVFDNIAVQILPPQITFQALEEFDSGTDPYFDAAAPGWEVIDESYRATPAGDKAISLLDLGVDSLNVSSILELAATLNTEGRAGLVFDYYDSDHFKFVAIDAATDQVIIGHHTAKSGWVTDATYAKEIDVGTDYRLSLSLKGTSVSVEIDGNVVLGYVFNAATVDGRFGLLATDGVANFDDVEVKTNDLAFEESPETLLAAAAPTQQLASAPLPALTAEQLDATVQAAIARLASTLDAAQLEDLHNTAVRIADLPGLQLGTYDKGVIWIDREAAGWGWFVDATAASDSEFRLLADGSLQAGDEAAGRMDLVSVLFHEMGHVLGHGHGATDHDAEQGDWMDATLAAGTRELPAWIDAKLLATYAGAFSRPDATVSRPVSPGAKIKAAARQADTMAADTPAPDTILQARLKQLRASHEHLLVPLPEQPLTATELVTTSVDAAGQSVDAAGQSEPAAAVTEVTASPNQAPMTQSRQAEVSATETDTDELTISAVLPGSDGDNKLAAVTAVAGLAGWKLASGESSNSVKIVQRGFDKLRHKQRHVKRWDERKQCFVGAGETKPVACSAWEQAFRNTKLH
ncbi:MAG: hypothetical protein GYB33_13485, partial [Gammaproteobacteria bacterium]|nr:hypothetical protein [Gammaproteobacteria bacterium]